jgi:hypothetical protein
MAALSIVESRCFEISAKTPIHHFGTYPADAQGTPTNRHDHDVNQDCIHHNDNKLRVLLILSICHDFDARRRKAQNSHHTFDILQAFK